jgi:hypothetical protein
MASRTLQAPPWAVRLLTPLMARVVAREMLKKDPERGQRFIAAVVAHLPGEAAPAAAHTAKPVSAWVLVAANLLPLYGVLFWSWEAFPLLVLFWVENVILGLLNAARMLAIDPGDAASWAGKLAMVPLFCALYGFFTAVHGVFVFSMFGKYPVAGLDVLAPALRAAQDWNLALPIGALAASHLFSFFWNYLYRGEFRRASLHKQMTRPYARVMILHVTLIFGGFGAMLLGSPLWALLVLLGVKIALDLRSHLKEHLHFSLEEA